MEDMNWPTHLLARDAGWWRMCSGQLLGLALKLRGPEVETCCGQLSRSRAVATEQLLAQFCS
jgi:hypothetical protein